MPRSPEKERLIREIGDEIFGTAERPDERLGRQNMERRLADKSLDELKRIKRLVEDNPNYVP